MSLGVLSHICNPGTGEAEMGGSLGFSDQLAYPAPLAPSLVKDPVKTKQNKQSKTNVDGAWAMII